MRGAVYVAYGGAARREASESIASLRRVSDMPITIASSEPMDGAQWLCPRVEPAVPLVKLHLDSLSPYDPTLYLDADTRIREKPDVLFDIIGGGWDMAMAFSRRQDGDVMGHMDVGERRFTMNTLGCEYILGLQAGVFAFARNERTRAMFAAWRDEWLRFGSHDQGALLRALHAAPVRLCLLGRPWNGGAAIQHLFGRARR